MSFSAKRLNFAPTQVKTVILTGGLNEAVTNLELKPGELTECFNYFEIDGAYHGYRSTEGYERYDGSTLASTIEVIKDPITDEVVDDSSREAQRATIDPVPGDDQVLGLVSYDEELYSFRNDNAASLAKMYQSTPAGWAEISGTTLDEGGSYDFSMGRYSLYKSNAKCLFFVDGVSVPHTYDGTTVDTIITPVTTTFPTQVGSWKNRLFLAYPGGHLLFSAVGDPTDWTTASVTGEIFIGEDIEEIVETPGGTLAVFTKNTINFIYYESATDDFIFRMENFSKRSGAHKNTVQRLLGTLYFADDRGISTLETVDAFGDFSANTIDKKVQRSYQALKEYVVTSLVDRGRNQYIIYFTPPGGYTIGLVFTFAVNGAGTKYLKGVGTLRLPHLLSCATTHKTSTLSEESYFGGDDGYVYKFNSGTSFDGDEIITKMGTAFYHYNTPTRWKNFKRATFEISADRGTLFNFRNEFNYKDPNFPVTTESVEAVDNVAGVWGVGIWGAFTWGGKYLTQIGQRLIGYGSNMRVLVRTTSKYKTPHTIHNVVIEYTVGSTKI